MTEKAELSLLEATQAEINHNVSSEAQDERFNVLMGYLNLGFSVIPVRPGGKAPSRRWTDYMTRRASDNELKAWLRDDPEINFAIVTGVVSGVVVLDVDGSGGFEEIAKHGQLPITPTVVTGRGKHFYFRHPGFDIPCCRLMSKVDLRGEKGSAVVPPSLHHSGRRYQWEVGLDVAIADLPAWLLKLLQEDQHQPEGRLTASRKVRSEIDRLTGELLRSVEGSRNDNLNKAAYAIGALVGGGDLDEDEAYDLLADAARTLKLPRHEAYDTIWSGLNAGRKKPKSVGGETYEFLDFEPRVLERPLQFIDGEVFAATWVPVGTADGDPTKQVNELVLIDANHGFYSCKDLPGSKSLDDLNIRVSLPTELDSSKRLSRQGFQDYLSGYRPDPKAVFEDLLSCIDAFVSFESFAESEATYLKLVACWTLGTYFMEAFTTVGYLWPNGERGSGKTQLLNTVSTLAYLGMTVTSGSTFASLRDEAHYGSTIAFDDCENVAELDEHKRELLLAGSTRGARVKVKESDGQKGWRSRSVNSFSPKLFSAIRLPDETLDSRTIRLPMVASSNREKTRRSPSRSRDWPVDVQKLIDDMWLAAVLHLPTVMEREAAVEERTKS